MTECRGAAGHNDRNGVSAAAVEIIFTAIAVGSRDSVTLAGMPSNLFLFQLLPFHDFVV